MVRRARHLLQTILGVTRDLISLASSAMRSRAQLAAENLFLRKQLALYQERKVKPRRADDGTRIVLAGLSHVLAWRQLLVIVTPETLMRWHPRDTGCSGAGNRARRVGRRFPRTSSG